MTKRPFRPIWGGCSPNINIFRYDFPTYIFIGDTPLSWYTSILILFSVLKFLSISFFDLPFFSFSNRERKAVKKIKDGAVREHAIITSALSGFLRLLAESDVDESGTITRKELVQAFDKEVDYFTEEQCRTLFGKNYKVNDIFDCLNHEGGDEVGRFFFLPIARSSSGEGAFAGSPLIRLFQICLKKPCIV